MRSNSGPKNVPISWSRWKVFGWNFGKGSIALCLSKNEEVDHEKLGVFGSENSSAITSGLRSAFGKNLRNWTAHEINYKTKADNHRACEPPAKRLGDTQRNLEKPRRASFQKWS